MSTYGIRQRRFTNIQITGQPAGDIAEDNGLNKQEAVEKIASLVEAALQGENAAEVIVNTNGEGSMISLVIEPTRATP